MTSFQRGNVKGHKLTYQQVADIRLQYARGATQGALARQYKMSAVQIGRIVRGESWHQVPAAPASGADLAASAHRLMLLQHGLSPAQVQELSDEEQPLGLSKLQESAAEVLIGNTMINELANTEKKDD